jgi:hypothetical protein
MEAERAGRHPAKTVPPACGMGPGRDEMACLLPVGQFIGPVPAGVAGSEPGVGPGPDRWPGCGVGFGAWGFRGGCF